MRILVVGGTRFIGAAAVRRLHHLGHDVAVLNRGQSPTAPPEGVRRIRGDRARLVDAQRQRDQPVVQASADERVVEVSVHPDIGWRPERGVTPGRV